MATNTVKIYLSEQKRNDYYFRCITHSYNRRARRIGFRDYEHYLEVCNLAQARNDWRLLEAMIRAYKGHDPAATARTGTTDHQRVKYLQRSYGVNKSVARKYLRYGIDEDLAGY